MYGCMAVWLYAYMIVCMYDSTIACMHVCVTIDARKQYARRGNGYYNASQNQQRTL